jgi:hypothetical protein
MNNRKNHNTASLRAFSYSRSDEGGLTNRSELDSLLHENKTHAMTQPRQHGPWQQSPC